jgi:hypothetical protein
VVLFRDPPKARPSDCALGGIFTELSVAPFVLVRFLISQRLFKNKNERTPRGGLQNEVVADWLGL